MVRVVKVTTDNVIQIVELPSWSHKSQKDAINAECVEKVRTQIMVDLFKDSTCLLVDESGACKGLPINRLASELYGVHFHGTPIHGDVIFAEQNVPEINPHSNPDLVAFFLKNSFKYLKEAEES